MEEFMTTQEVARLLRCTPQTITRIAQNGALRPVRLPGKLLFRREMVEQFLRKAEGE